jgi:hypothetical protein
LGSRGIPVASSRPCCNYLILCTYCNLPKGKHYERQHQCCTTTLTIARMVVLD